MAGRGFVVTARLVAAIVLCGIGAVAGVELVPPRMAHHALADAAHEEVVLAAQPGNARRDAEEIRLRLARKVVELGLDDVIEPREIHVAKSSSRVSIHVEYVRVVELFGYRYDWSLVVHEEGEIY